MPDQVKEATNVLMGAANLFYNKLLDGLSTDEIEQLNQRIQDEAEYPSELGEDIQQGVFTFVCPETGSMASEVGFTAHGNINPETKEMEVILTVDCKVCRKEHAIMVISLPEMMTMPILLDPIDPTDKN